MANVESIASAEGVLRLAFGTLDYAVELDLRADALQQAHDAIGRAGEEARPAGGEQAETDGPEPVHGSGAPAVNVQVSVVGIARASRISPPARS